MKLHRSVLPVPSGGFPGVVPLVNVVLLLLLFFLLGSSLVLQPGVSVSLPTSGLQLAPLVDAPIVSILRGSPPRLYFQDQPVADVEELAKRLATGSSSGGGGTTGGNRAVILRADRGTPYEAVMAVSSRLLEANFNVVLAAAPPAAAASGGELTP